ASHVKDDVESIAHGIPRAVPQEVPVPRPAGDAAIDPFQIAGPAAGLLLTGILGLLFWTVLGVIGFAIAVRHSAEALLFLLMPALGIPAGLGLIAGARRMMRCQDYAWANAAALWALVPWSPAWVIGLPAGIWALVVLRRPDVQAVFGVSAQQR